jgi:hypothetical protein
MYILYMLVLNNTPFVHARVYLQYLKSALPGYGLWMRIKDPHSYVVTALRDSLCYFIKHWVFIWKVDFMRNLIFGLQDFRKLVILNFLGVHYWKLDIWVSNVKSSGKDSSHIAMSLDMCVCDPILGTSKSTNKSRRWDQVRLGIVSSS